MNIEGIPAHIQYSRALNATIRFNLSHSCAQVLSLDELATITHAENLLEDIADMPLEYASVQGDDSLRHLIAEFINQSNHHNRQLTKDDVITFAGAQEALAAIYQSLILPGDEVVVCTPCYPSLLTMIKACGGVAKTLPLYQEQGWQLNLEQLASTVSKNTKLIVINAPHNPTGMILSPQQKQDIVGLAESVGSYLLSDDVTQSLVHHGANEKIAALSHAFLDYPRSIVVSVLSKTFGLPGIRIGWAVTTNQALQEKLLAYKISGSICTSLVDEHIARLALANRKQIITRNLVTIKENIRLVKAFVEQHDALFSWKTPQAGVLSLLEVKQAGSLNHWLQQLAANTGVLLLPVSLFGLEENFVRLGLGQNNIKSGLSAVSGFIENH